MRAWPLFPNSYDAASQLTAIGYTQGATALGNLTYGYDAGGRRTNVGGSLAATSLPGQVTNAVYNANNQLTNWKGATFTYDLNGNLTGDGTNTYTWDSRNQLAGMSGGNSAAFQYDAEGRRQSKTINGAQTGFVYDGGNYVQELTAAIVKANLLTGPGLDEVFARTVNGNTTSYLTDSLGSAIALTDGSGTITTQYAFEPYGKTTATGTTSDNGQQYTGRENDGTGLYYYRNRYYMPECGRFLSEDPIGIAGGMNLYQYAGGNPVLHRDPRGLDNPGMGPYDPGNDHSYHIHVWTPCYPISVAAEYSKPLMTGPGAPAISHLGTTDRIVLWGDNPISQDVNFDPNTQTTTITNTTLPGHRYYRGDVVIQIAPAVIGTNIDVLGTGTGDKPGENVAAGYGWFGTGAVSAALSCH